MFLGFSAKLNGEFRAAVQTAQAKGAFVGSPDGLAVFQFDDARRTQLFTKAAADAISADGKFACRLFFVGRVDQRREWRETFVAVEIALGFAFHFFYDFVNLGFGGIEYVFHLGLIAHIEHRCPSVGHDDGELRIGLSAECLFKHFSRRSRAATAGEDEIDVGPVAHSEVFQKVEDDVGNAPIVDGHHETERLAVGVPDVGGCHVAEGLVECFCKSLGHIFAVARAGKVVNHSLNI